MTVLTPQETIDSLKTGMGAKTIDCMVGLPSWQGGVDPETQICLDKLVFHTILNKTSITVKKASGSMIADNRNNVIKGALNAKVKYILFVDTDMIFPADSYFRLKESMDKTGADVMSAVAFSKGYPYAPNIYSREKDGSYLPIFDWQNKGVLEVDAVGGAFVMVRTSIFEKIDPPWFSGPPTNMLFTYEGTKAILDNMKNEKTAIKDIQRLYKTHADKKFNHGEDLYMCHLLKKQGVRIFADTDFTIGHMGRYMFSDKDFDFAKENGFKEQKQEK